ncbi:hypothetical protein ABVK25_012571, partial [Lepraria finkii]
IPKLDNGQPAPPDSLQPDQKGTLPVDRPSTTVTVNRRERTPRVTVTQAGTAAPRRLDFSQPATPPRGGRPSTNSPTLVNRSCALTADQTNSSVTVPTPPSPTGLPVPLVKRVGETPVALR